MALTAKRKKYLAKWREKNREKLRRYKREWRYKHGANPNYYYSEEEKREIKRLYEKGYSLRKLGRMFDRDRGRMGEMLEREGVELRSHKEALKIWHKRNSEPADLSKKNGWRMWEWSKAVIERDGKCKNCGSTEALEAHHIEPQAKKPDKMYDVDNGVTLCHSCHLETDTYGKRLDLEKSN